jgi:sugar O-acyltransferase (sialic acid O-acetyltransferase NeuD family)
LNEKIAIFGAGDLGKEILVLIRQINLSGENWIIEGFFDDNISKGTKISGVTVQGGIDDLNKNKEQLNLVFAIADPELKKKISAKITNPNIKYPVLVHPGVELHDFQNICVGKGSIICAGNIFTCDISIGEHVIINLNCTIGHDCIINNYCSIMPGVNLSGKVVLEQGVYIGTGAEIINYATIGEFSTIGAGATVIDDIQSHSVAVGTPARIIKLKY